MSSYNNNNNNSIMIEQATKLLNDILEQITYKDSPAINEVVVVQQQQQQVVVTNNNNNNSNNTSKSCISPIHYSPLFLGTQTHSRLSTPSSSGTDGLCGGGGGDGILALVTTTAANSSSADDESSSLQQQQQQQQQKHRTEKTFTFQRDYYDNNNNNKQESSNNNETTMLEIDSVISSSQAAQQQAPNNNSSVIKIGHGDFAMLCRNTLQKVEKESTSTTTTTTGNVPLQIEMPQQQQEQQQPPKVLVAATIPPIINSSSSPGGTGNRKHNNRPVRKKLSLLPWRNNNKQQQQQQQQQESIIIDIIDTNQNQQQEQEEEKKEDEVIITTPRRLQMFGSEYARHLSNCQLAPSSSTSITNNLPPKQQQSIISSSKRRLSNNNKSSSSSRNKKKSFTSIMDIEDATPDIQTGALLDIVVTIGSDTPPPPGYYRITQTGSGKPFALFGNNNNNNNKTSYINVKKEPSWDKAAQRPCITALTIIYPDRMEFVPPGFCIVRVSNNNNCYSSSSHNNSNNNKSKHNSGVSSSAHNNNNNVGENGPPANLNASGGERVFLCFRRSREGNPITGILPLIPSLAEQIPTGYTVVERTPRNHIATFTIGNNNNSSSNQQQPVVFLSYRQRLANLEMLRPYSFVQYNIQKLSNNNNNNCNNNSNRRSSTVLKSYYCTGGAVVESNVGRFHIMDRTTHSLLSPSSVTNRLNLMEMYRRRTASADNDNSSESVKYTYSVTYARSDVDSVCSSVGTTDSSNISISSYKSNNNRHVVVGRSGSLSKLTIQEQELDNSNNIIMIPNNNNGDRVSICSSSNMEDPSSSNSHYYNGDNNIGQLSSLLTRPGDNNDEAATTSLDPVISSIDLLQEACKNAMDFIPLVQHHACTTVSTSNDDNADERLTVRTDLLAPILTACYTRHGGSALLAVEGLTKLLIETDFFKDDVNNNIIDDYHDNNNNNVSSTTTCCKITLLDITIQCICDVATSGAQETTFPSCIEFIEHAVRYTQGQLNTRTIGFILRLYLFVFYFDASIPSRNSNNNKSTITTKCTLLSTWRPISMQDEEDFPLLYDPREDDEETSEKKKISYIFPGGASQAAVIALKDLISLSILRLGKMSVSDFFLMHNNNNSAASLSNIKTKQQQQSSSSSNDIDGLIIKSPVVKNKDPYFNMMDSIIESVIDHSVDRVERANFTQLALYQIHRSGGSELFWHEMVHTCGNALFVNNNKKNEDENGSSRSSSDFGGRNVYVMIFAILQQLIKVASGKFRPSDHGSDLLPKDVVSKMLSMELLLHFLEFWSDEQEAVSEVTIENDENAVRKINMLAYCIRRTVVPCLLWNTQASLENPQVFRRLIRIVSELWCSPIYRKHCKVELGVLLEHFGVKLLKLGPQLKVNQIFFGNNSNNNRDRMISLLSQQLELTAEIKNWFSNDPRDVLELFLNYDTDIAAESMGPSLLMQGTKWQLFQQFCEGLSSMAEKCGEIIGDQILHNQTMILGDGSKRSSSSTTTGIHDSTALEMSDLDDLEMAKIREAARSLRKSSLEAILQIVKSLAVSSSAGLGKNFMEMVLSWTLADEETAFDSIYDSNKPAEMKPSMTSEGGKKCGGTSVVKFWQKAMVDEHRQRSFASVPSSQESFATAFQIAKQKTLKKAIEYLIACNALTSSPRDIAGFLRIHSDQFDPVDLGFYLSESGTSSAELEYWSSIRKFFVRAMSFLGLSIEQGLRHFLTNSGFQLPGEAQRIDRLINSFAQCYFEDNAGDKENCPFKDQDTVYLISFAIIMLNTDLHKNESHSKKQPKKMSKAEFINNLKNAIQSEVVSKEYMSSIYDSIDSNPIAVFNWNSETITGAHQRSFAELIGNVRTSDSLLRGLAIHNFKFSKVDDFMESLEYTEQQALADLSCSCVSKTWHHWHGVVNTCLETAHLDPQGLEPAVDILLYALAVSVCLNMPMERSAFLCQLVRLRAFEERRQGIWVSAPDTSHHEEEWYQELEEACSGLKDSKFWALQKIFTWITSIKAALRVDVRNKVEMTEAADEIVNGDFLLQDPARSFLQSGNLIKKSARTGRLSEYRFYLFSDVLLYASEEPDGRYKIHEELPLHLMKIVDWFPPSQKNRQNMFEIYHPRKSFQVICPSAESRKSWVEDIRASILVELERKIVLEAARKAATRLPVN